MALDPQAARPVHSRQDGRSRSEARHLLQVKVSHADDAESVFSTLMGNIVEPRREFIQDLDV